MTTALGHPTATVSLAGEPRELQGLMFNLMAKMQMPAATRHVCHLTVCERGPAVRCPFRPARAPGRRPGDLIAIQLGSVRSLELLTPSVDVGLGHEVSLVRCRQLSARDPGKLDVPVHREVDHLA